MLRTDTFELAITTRGAHIITAVVLCIWRSVFGPSQLPDLWHGELPALSVAD